MMPIVRRGLGLLLVLGCVALWSASLGMSRRQLRAKTCQGKGTLQVTVTDSLERRFVAREDIEQWLDNEYRAYAGLPLDSVDLYRIERIICSHSAVRDCEAWLSDDGMLHVVISQRQPVVRFDDGQNGYYADATGFIFPLQRRGSVDVPVVSGRLPLRLPRGFKGEVADPAQRAWLKQIIGLSCYMQETVWAGNIGSMVLGADGNLTLTPREGKESFLFGPPVRVAEKFALMGAYYESVAPVHSYSSIDLRYRGQMVCRK